MPIAVDMDGIITNFTQGYTEVGNRLTMGRAPVINDYGLVKSWEFKDWYWPEGYTDELNEEIWKEILNNNHFWYGLAPLWDARHMAHLAKLERSVPLVFLTRRDGVYPWVQTIKWLQRYGIDEPLVVRCRGGEEKEELMRNLGIRTLIDDAPKYISGVQAQGFNVVKIEWPYNKHVQTTGTVKGHPNEGLIEALELAIALDAKEAHGNNLPIR